MNIIRYWLISFLFCCVHVQAGEVVPPAPAIPQRVLSAEALKRIEMNNQRKNIHRERSSSFIEMIYYASVVAVCVMKEWNISLVFFILLAYSACLLWSRMWHIVTFGRLR